MFASREVNSKTKDLTCGFTSGEVFHHCTFYVLKAQQVTRALSHVWKWQRLYPAAERFSWASLLHLQKWCSWLSAKHMGLWGSAA